MKIPSKRIRPIKCFILIGFLLANLSILRAQYDFLWIRDGYESETSSQYVGIVLSNRTELGGFQFLIQFDPEIMTLDTIAALNRLNDFGLCFYDREPGNIIVLVVSLSGETIAPGTEEVLRAEFSLLDSSITNSIPLILSDLVLSDVSGNTLPCAGGDGYLFHDNTNSIRIQNGRSVLPVNLSTTKALGGIQFNLSYDPNTLTFDSLATCSRISDMTISYSENFPGNVIVLIYNTAGDSIPTGYGTILNLHFSETTSPVAVQDVTLSNCTFSDIKGSVISAEYLNGIYFIPTEMVEIKPEKTNVPAQISLDQNFPNPFNASTTITFQIPQKELIDLSIYNIDGKMVDKIVSGERSAGKYSLKWNVENIPSGIYLIRLGTEGVVQTRKCLLVK